MMLRERKEKPLSGLCVLVVEDQRKWAPFLCDPLRTAGADVRLAASRDAAIKMIRQDKPAVVVLDLALDHDDPREDGIKILQTFAGNKHPWQINRQMDPAFIVATQLDDAQLAVDAMELGIAGFLFKRRIQGSGDLIVATVQRVWRDARSWKAVVTEVRKELRWASESMQRVVDEADKAAKNDSTVVISGETGSGKELIARRIHTSSRRVNKPFIAVDCGTFPKDLIESELFGHVKGAFTSAERDKPGFFEQANEGTLFLDEIGSLTRDMQQKFLRVLDDKRVRRVGGEKTIPVDVRVIAAYKHPLYELVEKGLFRPDLFYRLTVIRIQVPPLRERPEDVELLARHFNELVSVGQGTVAKKITGDAMSKLLAHSWPGNVRELRNAIENAVVMSDRHVIDADSLDIQDFVSRQDRPDLGELERPHETSRCLSPKEAIDQLRALVLESDSPADLQPAVSLIQTACRTSTGNVRLPRHKDDAVIICKVVRKLHADHRISHRELAKLIGNHERSIEAWIREADRHDG
jgi:DNA-binding NtrC family response regulator